MNKVFICGRVGNELELKQTQKTAVCRLSVATNSKYKNAQDEWVENTTWHTCIAFGKKAELCAKYLDKGSQVLIEGRLQTRDYEDNQQVKRYVTEIIVESIQFLGEKKQEDHAPSFADDEGFPF